MADITKTTSTLSIEAKFADGDTRTITLVNPVANPTAAAINAIDGSALVGDKAGASFLRWETAVKRVANTTYYDVSE